MRRQKKRVECLEGLPAIVDLEVTTEGIRTGASTERLRVPNFRGCNDKMRALNDVQTNGSREKIAEYEGTSRMTGMHG